MRFYNITMSQHGVRLWWPRHCVVTLRVISLSLTVTLHGLWH